MKTEGLIQRLGTDLAPAPPLARPWKRATVWLVVAVAYLAAARAVAWLRSGTVAPVASGELLLAQQVALAVTAAAAGFASFVSVIPGANRRVLGLPLVPGAVALVTLTWSCVVDVQTRGTLGIGRETDWPCVASIVIGGALLWAIGMSMLRRAAPLSPRLSSLLVGVAALCVANIESCLSRAHVFGITVLLWHGTATVVLATVLSQAGRNLLPWKASMPRSGSSKMG